MDRHSIRITGKPKRIYSGHLKLGGSNPKGDRIELTNYYMELNGKPFFGICGEFHYSRYPKRYWEDELLKMKAAGVNIVSSYIFWNHHEEDEGVFIWDGDRDAGHFVSLCAKHGLYVILRIGPFNHGEVRNGGLPDWLYGRPFIVRSNDEGYLFYVRRLFNEIGKQVSGYMYRNGGPVIGIQLENEHMHASPSWEFLVTDEFEWVGSGRDGEEHIKVLKKMAQDAGMVAPIYTCTGWGGASYIEDETLPTYSGYAFQPWLFVYCGEKPDRHPPTNEYLIRNYHDNNSRYPDHNPPYEPEKYPYACCELGGGMACWYGYRFKVEPESVEAATITRIAGGCNFIGHYMFHDGTNPIGKHGYLNEHIVPKVSYNFQAPIGEFGQIRDTYRFLKPLFYFLNDFQGILCPMGTTLPNEVLNLKPEDSETLRYAVRQKDGSGFVFLVNYQDHFDMSDQEELCIELELPGETVAIPGTGSLSHLSEGFTLKRNNSAILPFNLDLCGIRLKYSTTQLITFIEDGDARTYFFFVPDGMDSEYCLSNEGIALLAAEKAKTRKSEDLTYIKVCPGIDSVITITGDGGQKINICTLTREQSLNFWKFNLWGRERAVISNAGLIVRDDALEAASRDQHINLCIYPYPRMEMKSSMGPMDGEPAGLFTCFSKEMPDKKIDIKFNKVGSVNAIVEIKQFDFNHINEVYLQVDYLGNVGNAFSDGVLISDDFFNGSIWEIGLKRYCPGIFNKGMYFHIIPYNKGSSVVFDKDIKFRHDFSSDSTAEIYSIYAVPEYRLILGKDNGG
ncbi:MAG TPA: beta-galactosidase [Clostridia bacterium]